RVKSLDLSDNHFLKIPTVPLARLKRLEELIIGQNDFETVPEGAFFGLSNLKQELLPWKDLQTFDLSENPLRCDCSIMWLKQFLTSKKRNESLNTIICTSPERFHGESLETLSPELIGC
ncbi:unnamed protein product, partial [Sphagnum compactum]